MCHTLGKRAFGLLGVLSVAFSLTAGAADKTIKVGIVLDKGGKDDKSFNSAAVQGLNRAKSQLGVQGKFVEASDDNAFEPALRAFAEKDYDLIVGIGFAQAEAIKKVAAKFPQKHFAIVDAEVSEPNVRSLMFQEHEGSYVVGALAALASKSGSVGFIGGMDIPLIRRFQMGFEAGAKSVNPKIKTTANYVGVTGDAWNNPPKAKELAIAQYSNGADVIFAAAGASGQGLFDAAEEKKKFAIGVDSNQNGVKPGRVLTSMLKRVDVAVFMAIQDTKTGGFSGGTQRYGLANEGVDYAMDANNESLVTPDMRKRADAIKKDIISGKIQVPDYYKIKGGEKK